MNSDQINKEAHISVDELHIYKLFQEQVDKTIGLTKKYLKDLDECFKKKINFEYKTEQFNPEKQKLGIYVDGLYEKGSYVNKAFLRLTQMTKFTIKIQPNISVHINFYHRNDDIELIAKCIRRIYCMINVFGKEYIDKYNDTEIDILLYDAPRVMSKEFIKSPNEMIKIGSRALFNCVCGYANIVDDKFYICVTRRDSCLGLLTHELGHICRLDLSKIENNKYIFHSEKMSKWKQIVRKYFDVDPMSSIGNVAEGINNGNSSIVHAMFLALEKNRKIHDDITEFYTEFYMEEFIYAIDMLCKLLRWFKYKSLRELMTKSEKKYNQNSMMMEYILIRCIYLLHFDEMKMFNDDELKDEDKYLLKLMENMTKSTGLVDEYLHNCCVDSEVVRMEYYANV